MIAVRKLTAKLHVFCVREKGHLVVGGGYLLTLAWGGHNSVLMAGAYGVAALMATHALHRAGRPSADAERQHMPKHLAQG